MNKISWTIKTLTLTSIIAAQSLFPPLPAYALAEGGTEQAEPFAAQSIQISGIDEYSAQRLCDGNNMTSYKSEAVNITVSCENPFTAAYIMWNTVPEGYTLTVQDDKLEIADGFLHKLIEFDAPTEGFRLECPTGGELCDIYLFDTDSGDNYPEFVQRWEPPCKQADLLVLSAHADDEYLMFGGTIPYYAKERGLNVQVAYLTTHFDEQPRPHELLNGLWTAGVRNYPVLGIIGDLPMCPIYSLEEAAQLYDFNEVLEWFVEQIRIYKPSVIVTHDINGEYGHGAHMLAAKTAQDAAAISADPNSFPASAEKYGVWDVPKTYLHFWGENKIVMDWEQPLESFGGLTAKEAAERAYAKHESQHKWGFIVGYWKQYDIRQFGLYRTLVGADEKADFMDHIEPVVTEEETTAPETAPEPQTEQITEAETAPEPAASTADSAKATEHEPAVTNGNNSTIAIIIACAAAGIAAAAVAVVKRKK